ncbi:MAG: MAPEG family protein [Myxococcota bacterium]
MTAIAATPLLGAFAGAVVLLAFKAQVLGAATAATRGKLKKFVTQEDADRLGGEHVFPDDPQVRRIYRAHHNDLEALVVFLAVGLLYVVSGASQIAGVVYFALFPLARLGHTFAYLTRRARLRRDSYALGMFLNFIIGGHALWAILAQVRG